MHDIYEIKKRLEEVWRKAEEADKETLMEQGFLQKFFRSLKPEFINRIVSNVEFKDIRKRLKDEFDRRYSFGNKENYTLLNAYRFLLTLKIAPEFLKKVYSKFVKMENIDQEEAETYDPLTTPQEIDRFFSLVAAEILMAGGLKKVLRGKYQETNPLDLPTNKERESLDDERAKKILDIIKKMEAGTADENQIRELIDFFTDYLKKKKTMGA